MGVVASILDGLEPRSQVPTVEALATVLPPQRIREAVERFGRASQRVRALPAELTAWVVVLLGLFRRLSYEGLLATLAEGGWRSAPWSGGEPPTTSALSRARDRLGVEPMEWLFARSAIEWLASLPGRFVGSFRVFAVDGASYLVPDSAANREHFGAPASTRGRTGYPQMRVVALVDVFTRVVAAFRRGPFREGEITLARRLLCDFPQKAFAVLDRLFCCFDLLYEIHVERKGHFLVRVPRHVLTRRTRSLGRGTWLVEVRASPRLRRLHPELGDVWELREITYRVPRSRERIRLLTSWLDTTTLSCDEAAALYHERWQIETATGEIKTCLCECAVVSRPTALRSLTPARVEQEFAGMLIAYNATRVLAARAAAKAGVAPTRISFTGALRRVRDAVKEMMRMAGLRLLERYERLIGGVGRSTVPLRKGRRCQRGVKVKMSKHQVKRAA